MATRSKIVGTPRQVLTNSFVISKLPAAKYYQYEVVTFADGRDIKNPRRRVEIVEKLQIHVNPKLFTPRCIYDGTVILYSLRELPLIGGDSQTLSLSTRGLFHVALKKVSGDTVDFDELRAFIEGRQTKQTPKVLTAINVLQLIIRQAPNLKYPNNTRAFFTKDAGIQGLGGGLELWRGYFQSVRPTIGKVLINIDVSTAVMYKEGSFQTVALAVLKQNDVRALDLRPESPQFRQLKSFFKGVFITLVHRQGRKKIRGLVANAGNFEFENTNVKEYFKKAYGRQLAYPNIIGVQVGSRDHDEVIPAELCRIASDQRYTRKLPAEFSASMVKFSSKSPHDRLALISAGINNAITADQRSVSNGPIYRAFNCQLFAQALDYQNSPFMQDAGITVHPDPISVNGRVLPTPSIYYGNAASNKPVDMRSLGEYINKKTGSLPELVLVILPTSSADIYLAVKQFGDVHVGMPTQCVRENKIERANDQYCANLGMKINVKLGGVNALPRSPALEKLVSATFMIMGADVGHPAPGIMSDFSRGARTKPIGLATATQASLPKMESAILPCVTSTFSPMVAFSEVRLSSLILFLDHSSLRIASRPSHYITLRDDIYKHNIDELQELAFTLCHSYARATRSVSIPAPVYCEFYTYHCFTTVSDVQPSLRKDADIVCARGAFHFNPAMGYDAATFSSDEDSFDIERWRKNFKDRHPKLAMKMHFM
ncbi:hypothetical protein AZE42_04820 [Rhizopogon vesiculosus]|uniref:Piwi domain-containing protein n=1 Tax=Rhizopogon vesiculosus TaxID=180088 RepID=A0A1J8Q702_9AGAM|nr:hypothetical protein AZE42_04820 [Rhizopogon vesiculosus]